ncbi:hypothetical protein MK489_01420 [Myxococcota bacterium]|nr:hypothetical protein [Myxococcota bacterium]
MALPFTAAAWLCVAPLLPIHFSYRPNDLGIESLATLAQYPLQQETFWLVAGVAFACVFSGLLSSAFVHRRASPGRLIGREVFGALALLSALWLPVLLASALWLSLLACALWWSRRPLRTVSETAHAPAVPGRAARNREWAILVFGAIALSLLLVPSLGVSVWNVVQRIPDQLLLFDEFRFHAEIGQHLAWASALQDGELHGRDFFCLYGPLYDWSVVAMWDVFGRSLASWQLYWWLARSLGWLSLFVLAGSLFRRPSLALLLPLLLPWVSARIGLAMLGLACFAIWLRGGQLFWAVVAGMLGGTALLYSQEYGVAFLVSALLGIVVTRSIRGGLGFGLGCLAVVGPVLAFYASHGALAPMLSDLAAYPGHMMAGYAKLPFPSFEPLESALMQHALTLSGVSSRELRIGYALPVIFTAALLIGLPVTAFRPSRPVASLRALCLGLDGDRERLAWWLVAVFGLIGFRSALGRSDIGHFLSVAPAAVVLLGLAFDRSLVLWGTGQRLLSGWRLLALVGFALHTGLPGAAQPFSSVASSIDSARILVTKGHHPRGNAEISRVVVWVRSHTKPDEAVLFMPNNAAYYYLTERRRPIRFVLGSQMVTRAHREEALRALQQDPPALVVWDDEVLRVDELSDERVMGAAMLEWIDANYVEHKRIGGVRILAPRFQGKESAPRGSGREADSARSG